MIPLALALAVAAAPVSGDRYAIVLGYNGPEDDAARPPLRFADDDAARMFLQVAPAARRAWLLTEMDTATARAHPDLTDVARAPTRAELSRVLGELAWELNARPKGEREVIVYLAGHGQVAATGEGELALADGPLTRGDLRAQLVDGIDAEVVHLVVDACAAFHLVPRGESSGARRLTPGMLDAMQGAGDRSRRARTGVIVATADSREVHESSALGGGIFSYLLRSALAGGADVDADGRVEYAEAAAFIEAASGDLGDPRARLEVFAAAPVMRPHAELADLRDSGADHFLRFNGAPGRVVRVLDSHGVPMLEARRDPKEPVTLALVGQPFYIVQVDDQEAVLLPRAPGAYALKSLSFSEATSYRPRSQAAAAPLFQTPYSASFVAGFTASSDAVLPPRAGPALEIAWAAPPPERIPWGAWGGVSLGAAGAAAAVAVVATVGNLMAFGALEQRFEETRAVDAELAFEVEAWRTTAAVATTSAALFALTGGGLIALGMMEGSE